MTKNREGLEAALAASLVENLIGLLVEGKPAEVQREASVTLAIACFDDMAKIVAIQVWLPGWWWPRSTFLGDVNVLCGEGSTRPMLQRLRQPIGLNTPPAAYASPNTPYLPRAPPLLLRANLNRSPLPSPFVACTRILLQNNGVSMLAELVSGAATEVRSAAMGALMMITTVDAGEPSAVCLNTPGRASMPTRFSIHRRIRRARPSET